ncbi:MAG: class I SAM-dependent methyltransferase [Chloroflexota bacterium]
MTVDLGTGDGRAVLAVAARDPRTLHLGLDPVATAMAEVSRRAARPAGRGGLPNARFVVAAAETWPAELRDIATLVTVRFPWASLLRGCLGHDPKVAAGIAGLVAPGGLLELLLAPAERDRLDGLPTDPAAVVGAARATFEDPGLTCVEGRTATADEIRSSGSTWAKRLLRGTGRPAPAVGARHVVVVRFRRPADADGAVGADGAEGADGPAGHAERTLEIGPSGQG